MKRIETWCGNKIKFNKELHIATAESRLATNWKNETLALDEFLGRLARHTTGRETHEEYMRLPPSKRAELKDVGGYIGGILKGGRRTSLNVMSRDIVTLDADHAYEGFLNHVEEALGDVNYCVYSTRSHTKKTPRYRVLVFTDRAMGSDEYEAVSRRLAYQIGIDAFDDSTYQPHRLMYWGSNCSDVEYEFYHNDGPFINVDAVLDKYLDWTDASEWPQSSRKNEILRRERKVLGDPRNKKGIIGSFCKIFPISKVIEEFLPDVYKKENDTRYTLIGGTSAKGLVVYDDLHAYSNHATDKAYGKSLNAFDLVRVHKFGHLDEDDKEGVKVDSLVSYKEMMKFVRSLPQIKEESIKDILSSFEDKDDIETKEVHDNYISWMKKLELKGDKILPTFGNVCKIIENDPKFKDLMTYNELSQRYEKGMSGEAWKETDTSQLRIDIEERYRCEFCKNKVTEAVEYRADANPYHPIKNYLEGLVWDGVKRSETMFVDWLGCKDTLYTREVANVLLSACIARVYHPGYKFDTVPVLGGPQDLGKSSFIRLLAKDKYFIELQTYEKQKAVETTSGKWLVELVEMVATNKHEIEEQKAFISATCDKVRRAYARYEVEYKRQFCLIGTTNEIEYLKDSTGNRRFLPLECTKKLPQDDFAKVVDQIWAEAFAYFQITGPNTLLSKEANEIAKIKQKEAAITDDWEGIINEWLLEPADPERYNRDYNPMFPSNRKETRDRVCPREVWIDCLGQKNEPRPIDIKRINAVLNNNPSFKRRSTIRFGTRFGVTGGGYLV